MGKMSEVNERSRLESIVQMLKINTSASIGEIAETFHVKEVTDFAMPDADYNIAPTTFQPIIRESKRDR